MAITDAQIKERANYIGGSDAAAALGLSRWMSPLKLWGIKTGALPPDDLSDNEAVEMGQELEDSVARIFTKRTGKKLHRVNETVYHPKYPFLAANLDRRVVGEDAIAELKTCSAYRVNEFEEDIPAEFICQVMHYMACTGKSVAYVAILIGGQTFRWKKVLRDEDFIEKMIAKEVEFWEKYVMTKIMPTVITSQDSDTLFGLYPNADEGEAIVLDDTANAIIESLQGMDADNKALEKQIEKSKNELKAMLKDHSWGKTNLYNVTWRNQTTNRLNVDKLRDEMPEVAAKYLDAKPSRVLRVKKIKEPK